MKIEELRFDESGLIPCVVQDVGTKEVLTLAYMNEESLGKSLETRETWFYSRSRQKLWHKGETSGNTQRIVDLRYDCDQDALVALVEPSGPACHTGSNSCFGGSLLESGENIGEGRSVLHDWDKIGGGKAIIEEKKVSDGARSDRFAILSQLESVIAEREKERPKDAYTTYLFEEGIDKILKKVGEEASEVIIAAKNRDKDELSWESADLIYHLLVLLKEQKLPLDDVLSVLEQRHMKKSEDPN
ncbi:bifunctional phosphoribosyl-AMP cyclohydrolase/phosphoribosyl-ATP diphosphatase HisIE [Alkalihalobacillus sp. AL-G]|uniref:bifunctional phosphoribosyl-AMP cyclohydrolase/phosphoribosyl-ATP diphosphatase HisIE n=1 Tax=Alkalihalobacillus sp. AL-G TaxID=2926399 RepID=UPI00272CFCAB|nr:bifunctional phosphoribosyl-AMP cyclohydrolase/phosphoribosyl-ATP diphosphatase HisIE [Alkalihalobacillus sp. AL-G]WLD92920.1 bifunctional phosphoribosyl-AMP cyclohydrolase/phosphoribosyl-ATP diphosphatase HisIE [Alkalihalobacillus sp. AL-G]